MTLMWASLMAAILALIAEAGRQQDELTVTSPITAAELREAGVLPVPDGARKPASVLDHHEEGPEGQLGLI